MSRKRPEVTVFLSTTRKLVNVLRFYNRNTDTRSLTITAILLRLNRECDGI